MDEPAHIDRSGDADTPLLLGGLQDLQDRVGQELGFSGWRTVKQADIDTFDRPVDRRQLCSTAAPLNRP